MKMPDRFDMIYAHLKEKGKPDEDAVGYVVDVREDERKSKKSVRTDGLPAYTPKNYTVKFLNRQTKVYDEDSVFKSVQTGEWKVCAPKEFPNLDKPRYGIGDLIYNSKTNKNSIIVGFHDFKQGHEGQVDKSVLMHSQFWYKVRAPGQMWEPVSEVFIENGKEAGFIEIFPRKPPTELTPSSNE